MLQTLGWIVSEYDESVFIHMKTGVFITVCVDDLNLYTPDSEVAQPIKDELAKHFEITDLGEAAYYLGMHIHRTEDG